jgi:hypothetical protein
LFVSIISQGTHTKYYILDGVQWPTS